MPRSEQIGQPSTWKGTILKESAVANALLVCPNGHVGSLADHTINSSNGKVQPSVVCPDSTCDFREYITLTGWNKFQQEQARQEIDNGS